MAVKIKVPEELLDYCVRIRRHLHQNPEPSFEESKTAEYLIDELSSLGLAGKPVAGTGVYVIVEGGQPGPLIAIRADIDALRLQDEKETSYASQIPGVMHGCGHDSHTAVLMGMAKLLSENREKIVGKVLLFFQPAEELPPGGALDIINSGILAEADAILGLHVNSDLPTGTVGLREGPAMASVDKFEVEIKGYGGHASKPNLAVDPIFIGAQLINGLQGIVSRNVDPMEAAVVGISTFHGGASFNVIPETATLTGTVRTLSEEVRDQVEEKFKRITKSIVEAHGAEANIVYDRGYPVLISDQHLLEEIRQAAFDVLGEDAIKEVPARLGAEDFAYYNQVAPSAYFLIGIRNEEKGIIYPEHNPRFDIDEDAMLVGLRVFAATLERLWMEQ